MCRPFFATKRIGDIRCYRKPHVIQFAHIIPRTTFCKSIDNRPQHTYAAIAGGTTAKSYDDMFAASSYSIHHQLARTVARGHHRIALLWREQRQSAGLGDLNHRCIALYEILCHDGSHQRVFHVDIYYLAAHRRLKCLHKALAAIAHRHLHDLGLRHLRKNTLSSRLISLSRCQTALKRIYCYDVFQ